jgi:hypothetical protein
MSILLAGALGVMCRVYPLKKSSTSGKYRTSLRRYTTAAVSRRNALGAGFEEAPDQHHGSRADGDLCSPCCGHFNWLAR